MIGEFGVARFGNVNGSHELQKHSGIPNEVLRAIQWYTDLPSGPREAWQPFHAGFPVSDHYVVRYTRPDPEAERAGMVSTTVIIAGTDIYRHSLRPLLDHSAREPDVAQTCVSDPDSAAPEAPPDGLAGVIDALATSGKAVWLGQAGFSGMVAALWDALAPEDRRRLVFGMVWHPSTIPYPIDDASQMLMVFTAPAESRQRFDTWPVVNPSEPPAGGRTATAALRLDSDGAVEMASRLAIEQPTLVEWTRLVEAAEFWAELDDLVDERLRGFTHLLAALAPDQEQGADLKTAVVARVSRATATAGFAHVRGLRTFPVQAYPRGPDLPALLSRWAVRGVADSGAIDDLIAAVDAARVATVDEWSRTLAIALIDAASHDPVSAKARLTDLANRDQQETFDWLADACTDQGDLDLDLHLSTWALSCTPPAWLSETSLRQGWTMTHAVCCDIADPILAWGKHAQIAGRNSISDDILASRIGSSGTVNAALALRDAALLQVAGQLVAQDPALLQPARVADPTWRAVWLSAIEAGADPWSVVPATEAVSQLLGVLMEGEVVSDRLLNAAAESDGADLSGYPRRARVWEYLPLGIRDRFLERTARAFALSPTDQLDSLESDLIAAILRPENLEAIALLGVDRAVDVLEQLADHVTSEAVLAVTKGPKLPADCSSRLGNLVVSRELKEVAKKLAQLAKNRPDLRLAATQASVLLSDRVIFMLSGRGLAPPADEIQQLAYELMVKLYSRGPMDRNLWVRAGGDPADLPEAPTPRERWGLAAGAVATRARGAPALSVMLDVMIEDYDREDLKRLRRLL